MLALPYHVKFRADIGFERCLCHLHRPQQYEILDEMNVNEWEKVP